MDANVGYPSCEIEVRGHRLRVYFNRFLTFPLGKTWLQDLRYEGAQLLVYLICCGKLGTQFRVRNSRYFTDKRCPVCRRQKTEVFFFRDIKPLLPAEWWQGIESPQ